MEPAWLDKRKAEYLYDDANTGPVFMDAENYEQFSLSRELLGEAMNFVKENAQVEVTFYEGTAIGLELPSNVDLLVKETEPAAKGNTVGKRSGSTPVRFEMAWIQLAPRWSLTRNTKCVALSAGGHCSGALRDDTQRGSRLPRSMQ